MTAAGGGLAVRDALRLVAARLSTAGSPSPRAEAEILVAHVAGTERHRLPLAGDLDAADVGKVLALTRRRAAEKIPVQYLVGSAVSGRLDLAVGPGVFIPRPETELLAVAAMDALPPAGTGDPPTVVDLCAGSGTLALEIAHARPDVRVHAVELHEAAAGWLRHNAACRVAAGDTPIRIHHADATDPALLADHAGSVDVVVSNPPYVPEAADLPDEVAGHEPPTALFAGPDGLAVIRPLVEVAARLLRPGGTLVLEHDDTTGGEVAAIIRARGSFGTVERHTDLAGRPRYVTAVWSGTTGRAQDERGDAG